MPNLKFAAAVLIAALAAFPTFAQRGSADFTKFVALGDSYGAGVENNSLNERHQPWSWPAVIARQAGVTLCPANAAITDPCFAQPLVSYPGIGPEMVLTSLAPTISNAPGQGQPLMLNFGRPYNNLSIPGATVGALLQITGGEPQQAGEPTPVTRTRRSGSRRCGRSGRWPGVARCSSQFFEIDQRAAGHGRPVFVARDPHPHRRMEPPRRDWQEERGGRIDPMGQPKESPQSADDRIDQAIAESFPASDPPSFNSGVDDDA